MIRAILVLAAMLALASCSRADQLTRVVNRSSAPVTVTYVEARDGVTRNVVVAAGGTASLPPNRALADLSDLRLFADGHGAVWSDWTSMRGRLRCSGDCTITWFPGSSHEPVRPDVRPSSRTIWRSPALIRPGFVSSANAACMGCAQRIAQEKS